MPHPIQGGARPIRGGAIPRSITTEPDVETIDTYDSGFHGGWTGEMSEFIEVTSGHFEGAGCVRTDTPATRITVESSDAGSLPRYFHHGEVMESLFQIGDKTTNGPSYMLFWAWGNGGSDFWRFRWDAHTDEASLIRMDADASAPRGSTTAVIDPGTWYLARVVRDDGTLGGSNHDHTVTVYEAAAGTQVLSLSTNEAVNSSLSGLCHEVAQEDEGYLFLDHQRVVTG